MSELATSGRLEDHPFAEIAAAVHREVKTGELTVEGGHRRRAVWFLAGNPVAVVSADPQDHVAQVLLEHSKIGVEEAERLSALPETREGLASADFLAKDVLNWGVKFRFVHLCYDLFRWEEGEYSFREGHPPREIFLLKVPATTLILKGIGHMSRSLLADRLPDDARVAPGTAGPAEEKSLPPEEKEFLAQCRAGRTVAEILDAAGAEPDRGRQMLYALSCLGFLALPPRPGAATPAAEAPPSEDTRDFTLEELQPPADLHATSAEPSPPAPAMTAAEGEAPGEPEFRWSAPEREEDMPFRAPGPGPAPAGSTAPGPRFTLEEEPPGPSRFGDFGSTGAGPEPSGGEELYPSEDEEVEPAGAPGPRVSRRFVVALGAVAGFVAVAAVSFWWWSREEEPAPRRAAVAPTRPAPVPPAPEASSAPSAPAPESPPAPERVSPPPTPTPPAVPAPAATPPPSAPAAPERAPAAIRPAGPIATPPGASERYRNALEVYRAGDIDGAAAIWEDLLREEHSREFTARVLTACEPETVRAAVAALSPRGLVFLIGKQLGGRHCYRICFGLAPGREAAGRALAELPPDYRAAGAAAIPVSEALRK